MIREEIARLLTEAGQKAQAKGLLPSFALPDPAVQRPANPSHGDYSSSLPLRLARAARMRPLDIAQLLVQELPESTYFARVEVAQPGFVNFTLSEEWLSHQVAMIGEAGHQYGCVDIGRGQTAQVEFVSANPTGPLTAASGRGGALGDALANVLAAAGYRVSREYYVNDAGRQMATFNATLFARYAQALGQDVPVPSDGYQGAYMAEVAGEIAAEQGDRFLKLPQGDATRELGQIGLNRMITSIHETIEMLGIDYDAWFSEQSLYDRDVIHLVLGLLAERGYVEKREGAVWLVSTALGEDKDNVLVRSNGIPTYFASDIAYHYDKFILRKLDLVIDIWGADHQGHVPRMKAGVGALGVPSDAFKIIIHQMITLRRGEEIVRLSKRTGDIVTLKEVLEEVGADACRFFFLARSADSHMDFDLDLAKKQSNENPVFYVQYAHARIASILRRAGDRDYSSGDLSLLRHEAELTLIRKMLELPELVELMARSLEPHHLPHYAQELAGVFHIFYTQCQVLSREESDRELTLARLRLVLAAKTVLANTLHLMGIGAPEEMWRDGEPAVAETAG
jgi:arginyl-tRNA synthetase